MLRLTASLLVALYAVLIIWGEPRREPGVEVTRNNSLATTLVSPASARDETSPATNVSPAEAVQIALAAGEARPEAAPAAVAVREAEPATEPQRDVRFVTGTRVNLRAQPTTSSAIVGQVGVGDAAEVLSEGDGGWVRVRTLDEGTEAYIFGRFLSLERPA
ncbi:SH3 domain-containing protein [Roseitranquillus sediminis]|uniref:SH3 domain-containing protein n=1 Tax=Roseitranquillus sediminis TaxID=2809051 RepID=UPI001D0C87FE|nr:SH3 domain-containing protein [Roseitranquillus sediminis]MBM9596312.1 SH3 domain-containing protein [Roseitranquillus sediminis]